MLVDLPLDVQMADVSYRPDEDRPLRWSKPAPDPDSIRRAMDLIAASKAPILLLGGGVILADATAEFRELAERLSLPVIMTYMGKGGLPHDHPLNAGHAGIQVGQPVGNRYFLESDLVVGFGCRFTDRHTGKVDVYRGQRKFGSERESVKCPIWRGLERLCPTEGRRLARQPLLSEPQIQR